MTIKVKSTFGNYAWEAEAEVSDAQRDALAGLGLLQVLQRQPASASEKKMAGYEKRPEGFKRDSIPYTEENAKVFKCCMEDAKVEVTGEDGKAVEQPLALDVTVGLYTPTGAEAKFVEEKAKWAARKAEGKLPALADAVSYDGPLEESGEAPKAFLMAIRAYTKARMAELMKGI